MDPISSAINTADRGEYRIAAYVVAILLYI